MKFLRNFGVKMPTLLWIATISRLDTFAVDELQYVVVVSRGYILARFNREIPIQLV